MNHGPLPTRLVFLADLPKLPLGTKVRFLGCVSHHDQKTGLLGLQHAYPPPPSPCSKAIVDVNLLLESLKNTDTRVGEWVNVMGYVEPVSKLGIEAKTDSRVRKAGFAAEENSPKIQGVMLWSAGAIKLADYERSLTARLHENGQLGSS